ncbi:MAG: class I SAM-dependent methyltransferase [Epsilonproteobacteria bacterium]|nr:class I SAM-dependent methyltransferase [Campylobacterota bacterium]
MRIKFNSFISYTIIPFLTGVNRAPDVYITDGFYLNWRQMKHSMHKAKAYAKGICLDIGAGKAPYKKYLESNCENYIITDSEKTHEHMFKDSSTSFIVAEATALPFEDLSIDTVVMTQVLEHVFEYEKALNEAVRILKKEGVMLLSVPFIYQAHATPYDYHRFSEYGLKMLLQKYELEVLEWHYQGYLGTTLFSIINGFIWERLACMRSLRNSVLLPFILTIFTCNNVFGLIVDLIPAKHFSPNFFVIARKKV